MDKEKKLQHICFDMIPPRPDLTGVPSHINFLALVTNSLWRSGQFLRVRFLEGSENQKQMVAAWANEWTQYANLLFGFDSNDADAEIRVAFQPKGNWSYVGTDSIHRPHGEATLNLQDVDEGTTLHEFGHAIGCAHEHSAPENGIKWNKKIVYEYCKRVYGWEKKMVDDNIFFKYSCSSSQYTAMDPNSIMMYYIPKEWTKDGFQTGWNNVLSVADKTFIGAVYPGITLNFSGPDIKTAHCTAATGPGVMYNPYYGNSWVMYEPGSSFIDISFNQDRLYGGKKIYQKATLHMTHLASYDRTNPGYSPIDIIINGETFKYNYSPPSPNWIYDDFDITQLMQDGANKLRLQFHDGAKTNYWINSLKIKCSGGEPLRPL